MIENPNERKFYTEKEMVERQNAIPKLKQGLLDKLLDLSNKIETEEPFPHGNIDLDFIASVDDEIEKILDNWNY
jgi:hypothetical protein